MKPTSLLIARIALLAAWWLAFLGHVEGQAVTILHRFGDGSVPSDGVNPTFALVLGPNGNFYGGTSAGGTAGKGTIFEMTPQGQVTILHSFGDGSVANDGSSPEGLMLALDGNFYGTTSVGGTAGKGTVFRMTPQGVITILHSFLGVSVADGENPQAGLIEATDGNFYGTTENGGVPNTDFPRGQGTIYKITPQGVESVTHSFNPNSFPDDGEFPLSALVQASDGNLYGTTSTGGIAVGGAGIAFQITLAGSYQIIHVFQNGSVTNDAGSPRGALVQGPDGYLYGAAYGGGGQVGSGAAFKITLQGAVTILYGFQDNSIPISGQFPGSGLLLAADGNYYGTTSTATPLLTTNVNQSGTLFRMNPQGGVTFLHIFGDGSIANDGGLPGAQLIMGADGNIYGVTEYGGAAGSSSGFGTVFKITMGPPALTSPTAASGTVATPFSYQITGTNSPTSYSVTSGSPTLPAGLTLDATTGLITGTPTAAGNTAVSLTLTNASGSNSALLTFTIAPLQVPAINSTSNLYGILHTAFSYSVPTSSSTSPTTYVATGLPPGLSINTSTGVISGTPTTAGVFKTVTITATNSTGPGMQTLTITIFASTPNLGQEYSILNQFPNAIGSSPSTALVEGLDGTFYGVTPAGGGLGAQGTAFNLNTQGIATVLHNFGQTGAGSTDILNDGSSPRGIILGADGNFYGTTLVGGIGQEGAIFRIQPNGTETILYNFIDNTNVTQPNLGLVQGADGNFYGLTSAGGSTGRSGSAYQVTLQGKFTLLHSFGVTLTDGVTPEGVLIQGTDGFFYGTTSIGGTAGQGTIFKMSSQGAVTILHNFGDGSIAPDGSHPMAGLIQANDGNFYGTTEGGTAVFPGMPPMGTVYKMTPQGVVTVLHGFADGTVANDGMMPEAPVIQGFDGNLYGTTRSGGSASQGTVFEVILTGPSAGTEVVLHSFGDGSVSNDGSFPLAPLLQGRDGNFYGVASQGGSNQNGVAFTIQGNLAPTIPPTIVGSTTVFAPINNPLLYDVQALQSQAGSTTITGNLVSAAVKPAPQSVFSEVLALILPATTTPDTEPTRWILAGDQNPLLPPKLGFDSTSGTTTGQLIATPGVYTFSITPENDAGAGTQRTVTMFIESAPTLTSVATDTATAGGAYSYQVEVTDFDFAFAYSATNLPAWLHIDTGAGTLTGTPPGPGTYVFNPLATNLAGNSGLQVTLTVASAVSTPNPPTITSPTTASCSIGTPFTYQITASNNPTSLSAVNLPPGLLFNGSAGQIYGVPTTPGTYALPISATNASTTYATVLNLTIGPPVAPVIMSPLEAVVTPNAAFTYQISASGTVSTFNASGLPAGLSINTSTGVISGTPTVTGTGTFPVTITAGNVTGTSTATLYLDVAVPVTFSQWELTHGISGEPTAISFGDGVPDLLKYLFDINPGSPMNATDRAALPAASAVNSGGTQYLVLTYRQYLSATGVSVNLQTSSDLQNWTTVTAPPLSQQVGTDPDTGDPIIEVGVITTGAKQFVRLNVTSP